MAGAEGPTPAFRIFPSGVVGGFAPYIEGWGIFAQISVWAESGTPADRAGAREIIQRLERFLSKRLRDAGPAFRAEFAKKLSGFINSREEDPTVLQALRDLYAPVRGCTVRMGRRRKATAHLRARARIRDIERDLTDCQARGVRAYLDVGCAEGGLTAVIGDALGLAPENVHGCDIATLQEPPSRFVYARSDNNVLPYPDKSFEVLSTVMALHHFVDERAMIAELLRVLVGGGTLIVREHDCPDIYMAVFLDIVHALYAVVLNNEITPEEFRAKGCHLRATYRTRNGWDAVLIASGFTRVALRAPIIGRLEGAGGREAGGGKVAAAGADVFDSYYGVYRAPT